MATYESRMRTNVFPVTDVVAFTEAMRPFIERVEDFRIEPDDTQPNHVCLLGKEFYTVITDDGDEIDIVDIIQEHIADDTLVIMTCAGWEAYRYTVGSALLVTKTRHFFADAEQVVRELAVEAGILSIGESMKLSAQG